MSFAVASYNVLASAYIRRAWYRRTPALVLDPAWRVPALVQYVAKLNADLFCLQEVEPETFVALRTFLAERGYGAEYARKLAGRSEGLAILYRREVFDGIDSRTVAFADGAGFAHDSGYIAQVASLRQGDKTLGVINTHLTWDPPNTAREMQRGLRQVQQCLTEYQSRAADAQAWLISGDFNVSWVTPSPSRSSTASLSKPTFWPACRGWTCSACSSVGVVNARPVSPTGWRMISYRGNPMSSPLVTA
jgi:mRNA deadenylase 3'-5' endonuclease subunit Ccr4